MPALWAIELVLSSFSCFSHKYCKSSNDILFNSWRSGTLVFISQRSLAVIHFSVCGKEKKGFYYNCSMDGVYCVSPFTINIFVSLQCVWYVNDL